VDVVDVIVSCVLVIIVVVLFSGSDALAVLSSGVLVSAGVLETGAAVLSVGAVVLVSRSAVLDNGFTVVVDVITSCSVVADVTGVVRDDVVVMLTSEESSLAGSTGEPEEDDVVASSRDVVVASSDDAVVASSGDVVVVSSDDVTMVVTSPGDAVAGVGQVKRWLKGKRTSHRKAFRLALAFGSHIDDVTFVTHCT
jgi:hypothetical protein